MVFVLYPSTNKEHVGLLSIADKQCEMEYSIMFYLACDIWLLKFMFGWINVSIFSFWPEEEKDVELNFALLSS